jgi:hypothetical protein
VKHLAGAAAAVVLVMEDAGRRFDDGRLPTDVVPRGRKPLDSFLHGERYGPRGP